MRTISMKGKAIALLTATVASFGTMSAAQTQTQTANVDATIADLSARINELERQRSGPISLGGGTTLDIYGFVQADFFQDLDADQGNFTSAPSAGTNDDGEFDATVQVSRLGFRTNTPTSFGDIGTQIEFDFVGGGSDFNAEPRIRHANVTVGDYLLIGQFWSNFMPLGEYPTTLDFNGPVGISFRRAPQVRFSGSTGDLAYSASIEEGETTDAAVAESPRLTAALAYSTDLFTVRGAVLYGELEDDDDNEIEQFGLTLSGAVQPWEGGRFSATYTTGQAIGSILIGGGVNAIDGEANDVDGFTVEFRQDLGEKVNVGIAYGQEDYDLTTNAGADNEFDELESIHANVYYTPVDNLSFGLEYSRTTRIDASDNDFDADRIQAQVRFSF